MTNITQPKTGTVTINGRVYTHQTRGGSYAREVDLLTGAENCPRKFAILEMGRETVFIYTEQLKYHQSGHTCDADLSPIPATRTRPRELKDVVAELAKGVVPWIKYADHDNGWFMPGQCINAHTFTAWNDEKILFSPNPFKENPTIIVNPKRKIPPLNKELGMMTRE